MSLLPRETNASNTISHYDPNQLYHKQKREYKYGYVG